MKLFGRTSGYYLFWTGFVYFWIGIYLAFTHAAPTEFATMGFILALCVPLCVPPVARYFNMEPLMFDLFRRKTAKEFMEDSKNVYNLPKPKLVEAVEPKPQEHYRVGFNTDGQTTLTLMSVDGWGSITLIMNQDACEQMIRLLRATYQDNDSE